MRYIYVLIFSLFIAFAGVAQEKLNFGDTEKTNENPTYESDPTDYDSKRIRYWVVNNPKGTLKGNKCFEDVCIDMGFVFMVQNQNQEGSYSGFRRALHNMGVRTTIFFKNGPFWRHKLRKKRKECKRQIHDFNG